MEPNGFWQLGNEGKLGIFANDLFGNDTIGLGYQLENQIRAAIGTKQFYMGMFAVNLKVSGSHHETFDPSAPRVELPVNNERQLLLRSAGLRILLGLSGQLGCFLATDRIDSRPCMHHQSRPSHSAATKAQSYQSQTTSSLSTQVSREPSSPNLSERSSPRDHEEFSPISPIGGSAEGPDRQGLFPVVRGRPERMHPRRITTTTRHDGHDQASWQTHLGRHSEEAICTSSVLGVALEMYRICDRHTL